MLPAQVPKLGSWIAPKATSTMNQNQRTTKSSFTCVVVTPATPGRTPCWWHQHLKLSHIWPPILCMDKHRSTTWLKQAIWVKLDWFHLSKPVRSHTAKISKVFKEQQGAKNRRRCSRGVVLGVLLHVLYWKPVSLPKCHPWWVPPSYLQNLFALRTLDGKVLLLSRWKTSSSNLSLREPLTLTRKMP